jgi:hypothetical protein
MRIVDLALDERINGYCATAVCSYDWYLAATTGAEANLSIQRSIIRDSKAYRTLRADLKRGCILPPLVLAISGVTLPDGLTAEAIAKDEQFALLAADLVLQLSEPRPDNTFIIDGLQRTNALRQTVDEMGGEPQSTANFLARPIRVEIWLNIGFGAIAYRMLLLNAGQKPMPIKRQVEVLSMKLKEDLAAIEGLDIRMSLSSQRRTHAGQFVLANLSQAFQAWLQGAPNLDVRNTVMEQLLAESAIDTLGTSLSGAAVHHDFKALVGWFVELDGYVWQTAPRFFANETVLLGISAAVGAAQRNDSLRDRVRRCLDLLRNEAAHGRVDVLGISRFDELRQGVDVRKVNVGQFTRDMVYRAFQEFFISDGTKSMEDCWAFGAAQA